MAKLRSIRYSLWGHRRFAFTYCIHVLPWYEGSVFLRNFCKMV